MDHVIGLSVKIVWDLQKKAKILSDSHNSRIYKNPTTAEFFKLHCSLLKFQGSAFYG